MISPAPAEFDGKFSEFYHRHVEPNLPTKERVEAFDLMLRSHLSGKDPVFVVRYSGDQVRGQIVRTAATNRILPTDNSPIWWTHSFLLSGERFPDRANALFETMPCHFHQMGKYRTLNQAGYHAAHIIPAKNRDTDWRSWSRDEVARRMLVNLHPCNMFLTGLGGWRDNGGRADVIAWVVAAYVRRFGETMDRFLADCDANLSSCSREMADPHYSYGFAAFGTPLPNRERVPAERFLDDGNLRTNRPIIWRDRVGKGIVMEIATEGSLYRLFHDDLVKWVRENMAALDTASWRDNGIYSWRRPTSAMAQFLREHEIPATASL